MTSFMNHEGKRIRDPKKILQEEELFFEEIYVYTSNNFQNSVISLKILRIYYQKKKPKPAKEK